MHWGLNMLWTTWLKHSITDFHPRRSCPSLNIPMITSKSSLVNSVFAFSHDSSMMLVGASVLLNKSQKFHAISLPSNLPPNYTITFTSHLYRTGAYSFRINDSFSSKRND